MSDLEVAGGAGGLAVAFNDLEAAAGCLARVAGDVLDEAGSVLLMQADLDLAVCTLLAPQETLSVRLALAALAGPDGLLGAAGHLELLNVSVMGAMVGYRAGERAVEATVDSLEQSVGYAIGSHAPVTLPVLAAIAAAAGPEEIDEFLFDHPWLVPSAVDGAEGLVAGVAQGVPGAGPFMGARSAAAGVPYPPVDQEGAIDVILASSAGLALDESDFEARVRAADTETGAGPHSLAELVSDDGPTSGGHQVRVSRIVSADGSAAWVVDIPGTRSWDPQAGADLHDLTSNMAMMAQRESLLTDAVGAAVADAQGQLGGPGAADEPILLTGHSQGGIAAAALASNPAFRRRFPGVRQVATTGSPVARMPMGPGVSVMSIEHEQDPVPGLDGQDNPDRRDWVTVRSDVEPSLGEDARATQAHDNGLYEETAREVDRRSATDPSLRAWREDAAPFLDAESRTSIDYDISRVPKG